MPFGRERDEDRQPDSRDAHPPHERSDDAVVGVWLRAAAEGAPDAAWLDRIEALLGLDDPAVLRYADARRGQWRSVRLSPAAPGDAASLSVQSVQPVQPVQHVHAFLLAGDTRASGWVGALLVDHLPAQAWGRALLAGTPTPPTALPLRGVQVCNCFDVTEPEISAVLRRCAGSADARLAQLQAALKCGTNCGSCLPALRQQVQRIGLSDAAAPASM
jgi:assimilatory nitrate reductase catalytic subunit